MHQILNVKSKDLAFFFYVGKRLHTFCTPFAHFPNIGSFCARCAQPAFLCIKSHLSGQGPSILLAQDRSVTQKPHWGFCCFANVNLLCKQNSRQFSAFVCVHQPDGFKDLLTGDFCCRRLFVLPGLRCCRGQVLGIEVRFDLLGQLQPGLVLRVGISILRPSICPVTLFRTFAL